MLARDRLGHNFSLNYEGRDNHSTWLGTVLSFVINILVLIILTQKSAELFIMTDPSVQVTTRPMLEEEVDETGEIYLAKHKMPIGFIVWRDKEQYEDGTFDITGRESEIEAFGGTFEQISSDHIALIVNGNKMPLEDCKD